MSPVGSGAGAALGPVLLTCAGIATLMATLISFGSIYIHLKNYRRNVLQRMVVRIMIMIPIYGISSFVSLFSLQAAFFIDAIRDIYEAFVIYVFFQLLIAYLGGERSLLILLHGRPPVKPLFPVNLFKRELDASDPHTYLWLKRGILQYVQVKPILAAATIILKALGMFDEGDLKAGSGYLYISIFYNVSICIALYCLAMFWVVVNADLRPFRPIPKFLCVKGILFFSFWQSFFISILVAAGAVRSLGPYKKASYISLALTDLFICLEMPLFAIAHTYAFSHTDYIDPNLQYCARMPIRYAFRDAFGFKDVIEDSKATLRGEGMDYRSFEPAEGKMHQGSGRNRRIKAGLRYAQGGKQKYWLPHSSEIGAKPSGGPDVTATLRGRSSEEEVHAPLLEDQVRDVVGVAQDHPQVEFADDELDSDGFSLTYSDPHTSDDELYTHSRAYVFGDYNYPCIDVSGEMARRSMREEEERILRDERAAYFSPSLGPQTSLLRGGAKDYGTTGPSGGQTVPESRHGPDTSTISRKLKGKVITSPRQSLLYVPEEQIRGATVIDMESDRTPDMEVGGVKMKWTRSQSKMPMHQHRDSARTRPSIDRDESDGSFAPNSRSPSTPNSRRRRSLSPRLPHDAVDLVVEDPQARDAQMSRERRKGEPAGHDKTRHMKVLRHVYKHGYKAEQSSQSNERALVDGAATSKQDGRKQWNASTKAAEVKEQSLNSAEDTGVADVTVAQAVTTLPLQGIYGRPMNFDEDDNPWLQ